MGMHFGILAVRAPLATLTDRLAPLGVGLGDELDMMTSCPRSSSPASTRDTVTSSIPCST